MNLASVHSMSLNEGLHYHIWIGIGFTIWDVYPGDEDHCVALSPNGKWKGFPCSTKLESICKIQAGIPLTTSSVHGLCPNSEKWISHGSYCYLFDEHKTNSFKEALHGCIRKGWSKSRLVSIKDLSEQVWLAMMAKRYPNTVSLKIGLFWKDYGCPYNWMDNTPLTFQFWSRTGHKQGKCVVLYNGGHQETSGSWRRRLCSDSHSTSGYICKVPKLPYPTTPSPE
ncbi:DgyrCDS14743 [Dimorphilus gyrociliatus]|uniref:DgyrCDS14743 n=1 Tax=Dimorphilus gyrociliatus TaxID=2664684 RepID=A0A7I8WEX1_9ANNE|nr:DgyrCDS14743 [Dimorphilus gyrociliatus]